MGSFYDDKARIEDCPVHDAKLKRETYINVTLESMSLWLGKLIYSA